jgi:hypothetical protein
MAEEKNSAQRTAPSHRTSPQRNRRERTGLPRLDRIERIIKDSIFRGLKPAIPRPEPTITGAPVS